MIPIAFLSVEETATSFSAFSKGLSDDLSCARNSAGWETPRVRFA